MTTIAKVKFEGAVQPWGNSLGIRITRPMSNMAHLKRGDKVDIEVTADGLLIRRRKSKQRRKLPYSEDDLLTDMTPHKAHADELPSLLNSEAGG